MKYSDKNAPYACMQTTSSCYKGTKEMKIKGVLIHSTGANNVTLKRYVQPSDDSATREADLAKLGTNKYGNDWNHKKGNAGVNAFIGKFEDGTVGAVQTMPWNYAPWGCGKGSKGSCNDGWIQFEICEDKLTDAAYFSEVYAEACELVAYLCKKYSLDPSGTVTVNGVAVPVITCHADASALGFASNHADVNHWFPKHGKSVATLRSDVAELLGSKKVAASNTTASGTTSSGTSENSDNSKTIWDFLYGKLSNAYAVAGLMGNLYAESGLRANNLQNSFEKKLGLSDVSYTAAVDSGSYANFVKDGAGYGLAQWTYWSRKQNLQNYAKSAGKSIGDLEMQLGFLWQELQGYKSLMTSLKAATSVSDASTAVLTMYEKPADQSDSVKTKRAEYSQTYYDKYAGKSSAAQTSTATQTTANTASYKTGDYIVVASAMRLRSGPGTSYKQLKFSQMTASAQSSNKVYASTGLAYYKVGTVFTAQKIQQADDSSWWAKTPSGWICIADSKQVYCKAK